MVQVLPDSGKKNMELGGEVKRRRKRAGSSPEIRPKRLTEREEYLGGTYPEKCREGELGEAHGFPGKVDFHSRKPGGRKRGGRREPKKGKATEGGRRAWRVGQFLLKGMIKKGKHKGEQEASLSCQGLGKFLFKCKKGGNTDELGEGMINCGGLTGVGR